MATIIDLRAAITALTQIGNNGTQPQYQQQIDEIMRLRQFWSKLNCTEYSTIMLCIASIYRHFGLYQEALDFLEKEYPQYEQTCKYEYPNKSRIFEIWADLLLTIGRGDDEILEKLRRSVYFVFIDNTSYSNFDYFSFRSFPKQGAPLDEQYSLNDIRNNTLSFSSPSQFNDPMDTVLFRWNEYRKSIAKTDKERKLCSLYEQAIRPLKIRCFARRDKLPRAEHPFALIDPEHVVKPQNIEDISSLMWAHYTNSHQGFCVKYSFPSDFVMNNDHQQMTFTRIGNMNYKSNLDFTQADHLTVMDALFLKDKVWEYETEVRIIHYDPNVTENFKLMQLPEGCIREIYLGMKCSKENEKLMREAIGGRNIPLFRMATKNENIYQLVAERID